MRCLRAAALLAAAACAGAQNIYDACNYNDAHGLVAKARLRPLQATACAPRSRLPPGSARSATAPPACRLGRFQAL